MKVIILEDEIISRQKIEEFVLRYDSHAEIILSTDTFDEVAKYLLSHNVDLILADIQVFDGNVFEKLSKQPIICPFIFITAYDNYTFEALENYGIGYLLKPYTYQQFSKAMDRFCSLSRKVVPDISRLIDSLKGKNYRERLIVKSKEGVKILRTENIQYAQIEDGVIFVFNNEGDKYMLNETTTLNSLENLLDPKQFFRINKSQIIHMNAIKSFEPYGKERIIIKTEKPGLRFITSVNKTSSFRKWVSQ